HGADPVMVTPNRHSTLGDFIILILKIFGYLILGSILIGIVAGLFTAGVALFSLSPLKDYVIGGYWQNIYALVAVILLIWLPVVGIIIWIIRRLIKAKSSKALRISFISLWLVGLIAGGLFLATLYRDFKFVNDPIPQQITLTNAKTEKLNVYLDKKASPYRFRRRWFVDDDMSIFFGDSTELNNTRLILRPSKSDSFSVSVMKFSNGNSIQDANQRASAIELDPIVQQGEQLNIPCSFNINKTTKFRNQFVLVTIGVPIGRKIEMHTNRGGYNNRFYLSMMGDGDWDDFNPEDFDGLYDYGDALNWDFDREYIMTKNGLEATHPDLDASKDRIKSAEEIIQEQQDKIKAEKERIEKSLQEDKDKLQKQIEQHQKELEEQLQRAKKALPETTGNASIDIKTPVMWIGKTLLRLS
ncbi:MAG TPA: hypothetical protein VL053_03820, partial [Arachidicoccus sp.]|nr:hypothetical protein [Arachidicoccus sp.]